MSGLESLPPDQRAVLQLILVQGRGYADLAATLRLDAAAVRERAHAGAAALAGNDDALDPDTQRRVVDYLLGQQDDGERIVTFAELGDSPEAARWAQALRERLVPLAREQLPELPTAAPVPAAAVNGGSAVATMPEPAAPTAALPTIPPAPPAAPPRAPLPRDSDDADAPRPSRLGGAILIAGALALAVVLAIVLIGGGDDGGSGAGSTSGAQTPTAARTTPRSQSTGANPSAQARPIGVAALRPVAGGSALGAAIVQQYAGGRRLVAVEATRLPGNAGQQFYGIWLQGSAGDRFLGFVPNQVRANGSFTVSSPLARDLDLNGYASVLVTTEDGSQSARTPTTPGATVLSGPLRLAG